VELWDEINRYAMACGGAPSRRVYGNAPRMAAVARVEAVIRLIEEGWANALRSAVETDAPPLLRSRCATAENLAEHERKSALDYEEKWLGQHKRNLELTQANVSLAKDNERLRKAYTDHVRRIPGCLCQWEIGDSPCPVHDGEAVE
jgi:hypothetical protein